MTQGLANRINIQKANMVKDTSVATAQLSSDTSKYVADKSAGKLDATGQKLAMAQKRSCFL